MNYNYDVNTLKSNRRIDIEAGKEYGLNFDNAKANQIVFERSGDDIIATVRSDEYGTLSYEKDEYTLKTTTTQSVEKTVVTVSKDPSEVVTKHFTKVAIVESPTEYGKINVIEYFSERATTTDGEYAGDLTENTHTVAYDNLDAAISALNSAHGTTNKWALGEYTTNLHADLTESLKAITTKTFVATDYDDTVGNEKWVFGNTPATTTITYKADPGVAPADKIELVTRVDNVEGVDPADDRVAITSTTVVPATETTPKQYKINGDADENIFKPVEYSYGYVEYNRHGEYEIAGVKKTGWYYYDSTLKTVSEGNPVNANYTTATQKETSYTTTLKPYYATAPGQYKNTTSETEPTSFPVNNFDTAIKSVITLKDAAKYNDGKTKIVYNITDGASTPSTIGSGDLLLNNYDIESVTGSSLNEKIANGTANEAFVLGTGNDTITINATQKFGNDTVVAAEGEKLDVTITGLDATYKKSVEVVDNKDVLLTVTKDEANTYTQLNVSGQYEMNVKEITKTEVATGVTFVEEVVTEYKAFQTAGADTTATDDDVYTLRTREVTISYDKDAEAAAKTKVTYGEWSNVKKADGTDLTAATADATEFDLTDTHKPSSTKIKTTKFYNAQGKELYSKEVATADLASTTTGLSDKNVLTTVTLTDKDGVKDPTYTISKVDSPTVGTTYSAKVRKVIYNAAGEIESGTDVTGHTDHITADTKIDDKLNYSVKKTATVNISTGEYGSLSGSDTASYDETKLTAGDSYYLTYGTGVEAVKIDISKSKVDAIAAETDATKKAALIADLYKNVTVVEMGSVKFLGYYASDLSGKNGYVKVNNENLLSLVDKKVKAGADGKTFTGSWRNEEANATATTAEVFNLGTGKDVINFSGNFGADTVKVTAGEDLQLNFTDAFGNQIADSKLNYAVAENGKDIQITNDVKYYATIDIVADTSKLGGSGDSQYATLDGQKIINYTVNKDGTTKTTVKFELAKYGLPNATMKDKILWKSEKAFYTSTAYTDGVFVYLDNANFADDASTEEAFSGIKLDNSSIKVYRYVDGTGTNDIDVTAEYKAKLGLTSAGSETVALDKFDTVNKEVLASQTGSVLVEGVLTEEVGSNSIVTVNNGDSILDFVDNEIKPENKEFVGTWRNEIAVSTPDDETFKMGKGEDVITFKGAFGNDTIELNGDLASKLHLDFGSGSLKFATKGNDTVITSTQNYTYSKTVTEFTQTTAATETTPAKYTKTVKVYNYNFDKTGGADYDTVPVSSTTTENYVLTSSETKDGSIVYTTKLGNVLVSENSATAPTLVQYADNTVTIKNIIGKDYLGDILVTGKVDDDVINKAPIASLDAFTNTFVKDADNVVNGKIAPKGNDNQVVDVSGYISDSGKGVAITTGKGDDSIIGSRFNDTIKSKGGYNTITETAGTNKITLAKGGSDLTLTGGSSNTVTAKGGANTIELSSAGKNKVTLGAGNDDITVNAGVNTVKAGAGNNEFTVEDVAVLGARISNNTYVGGKGVDTVTLDGVQSVNNIKVGAGADIITVAQGYNTVDGGAGNDIFTVTGGTSNVLKGGAGKDEFTVLGGVNAINGGAGDDTFKFVSNTDIVASVNGGAGKDTYNLVDFDFSDSLAITDKSGKNTIILDGLDSDDYSVYFNVSLNKKGTKLGSVGKTLQITNDEGSVSYTQDGKYAKNGTLKNTVVTINDTNYSLDVKGVATQVAAWLKSSANTTGMTSTDAIFNAAKADPTNTLYTGAKDALMDIYGATLK